MPARVYIETSVPSAYVSNRTDPGSQFRRQLTRQWWSEQLPRYAVVCSDNTVAELQQSDWPGKREALLLVEGLPRLAINPRILEVVGSYVEERVMPGEPSGDALHLAIAAVHGVEFVLTWNIRHLANPNKLKHLRAVHRRLGLHLPQIVTPDMLWLEI